MHVRTHESEAVHAVPLKLRSVRHAPLQIIIKKPAIDDQFSMSPIQSRHRCLLCSRMPVQCEGELIIACMIHLEWLLDAMSVEGATKPAVWSYIRLCEPECMIVARVLEPVHYLTMIVDNFASLVMPFLLESECDSRRLVKIVRTHVRIIASEYLQCQLLALIHQIGPHSLRPAEDDRQRDHRFHHTHEAIEWF